MNACHYANMSTVIPPIKKAMKKECLKKHIMVFLEARYLGTQQLTMKNA